MLRLPVVLFSTLFVLVSCSDGNQKAEDEPAKDSLICIMPPPDTSLQAVSDTITKQKTFAFGLESFDCIEQVTFSIPLPLKEYPLDESEKRERGDFLFINRKNKDFYITVNALFRSDKKVKIEDYFKNSYTEETEAEAKIVTEKKLVPGTSCFYAKGFWSNLGDKQRFTEVTWLRSDDVVVLKANYAIKDTAIWDQYLSEMIRSDSDYQ
ncbi:MAG: hypothetical protein K0S33_127 [Bacteroidetes bacterium]|jgi:hypothetical protein|nr:hypothetical protein [Bacteroidota bacterium]